MGLQELIRLSRSPLPYSQKVIELFRNPKNLGKMENPTPPKTTGASVIPRKNFIISAKSGINHCPLGQKQSSELRSEIPIRTGL